MNNDEKLEKVCNDFSKLSDEQKDYILGILQALVFAKTANNQSERSNTQCFECEGSPSEVPQN